MNSKPFYQSKTLIVNFLIIVAALLAYVMQPDFPLQLDQPSVELAGAILAGVNILLRLATSSGVSLK